MNADLEREHLGRLVRETWVAWAREQPNPKPHWLLPWEELAEPDREVDRRIGEAVRAEALREAAADVRCATGKCGCVLGILSERDRHDAARNRVKRAWLDRRAEGEG